MGNEELKQTVESGGSTLNDGLGRLFNAWDEMQKFGQHDGECTFSEFCDKCGTPLDACEYHSGMMENRISEMENAIDELKRMVVIPNAELTSPPDGGDKRRGNEK